MCMNQINVTVNKCYKNICTEHLEIQFKTFHMPKNCHSRERRVTKTAKFLIRNVI